MLVTKVLVNLLELNKTNMAVTVTNRLTKKGSSKSTKYQNQLQILPLPPLSKINILILQKQRNFPVFCISSNPYQIRYFE